MLAASLGIGPAPATASPATSGWHTTDDGQEVPNDPQQCGDKTTPGVD
ncbi:hypothetical protein Apa02nite_082440 [Actinoplanes palleronii]|uniref:Uncharacterized protein n=1 Tax=Actinoplanes palleronii TaxID=113570 RepID=A0ABQ4BN74_9ACTN|nr:hypothetical protein Apa02nite_082440 [Actinoplanes palleronii]